MAPASPQEACVGGQHAGWVATLAEVGGTEWEAFLASHTHEWEFTAKASEDDGERRGVSRRRRHGGEHARPGAHQRDTSFYAYMAAEEELRLSGSSRQRSSERRSIGGTPALRLSGPRGSLNGRRLSSARSSADSRDVVLRRRRALAAAEAAAAAPAATAEALEAMAAQAAAEGGPDNDFTSEMLFQRARMFRCDAREA
ncbi:hypothetical protein WJX81_003214 [Elliptochloris bilobata]|uniref:Uncharacterized protein n=1 Tax=Elliptochloris bilobata TaxID=381761 RepID=A0AAW1RFI9_9CHLO